MSKQRPFIQTFANSSKQFKSQQNPSSYYPTPDSTTEAYCTLNQSTNETYEEISSAPRTPTTNKIERKDYFKLPEENTCKELEDRCSLETPTIFEDLSENIRFLEINKSRKPAPITRPPPPPLSLLQQPVLNIHDKMAKLRVESGEESLLEEEFLNGSDSSASSSVDRELHEFSQTANPCHEPIKSSREFSNNNGGRESGYGTNKSRLWGSPPTSSSGSSIANQHQQQQRITIFNGQW